MVRLRMPPSMPPRAVLTEAGVAVLCVLVFWLPLDGRAHCSTPGC
jgi:hypothetical protein